MQVSGNNPEVTICHQNYYDLLKGEREKLAPRQIDNFEDVNFNGTKDRHRINFRYNDDIGKNVVYVVENATNESVKQIPSEARVDSMIRLQKSIGKLIDEEV